SPKTIDSQFQLQAAAETRLLTLGAEDLAPDWRRRLQAWPESAEESFESPAAGQPHQLSERSAELKVLSYDRLEAATFAASSAAAADSRSNLNEFLPATEFITEMDPRGRASLALSDSAVHGGPTDDSCSLIDPADPELWLPSDLTISPTLQVFAFPSSVQHQLMKPAGSDRWFPRPKPDQTTGLCPYLPMDLGSVAAALALCPGDGDSVLDLCSAPGSSRLARLLSSHVPPSVLAGCSVSQLYANALNSGAYPLNSFDRVLVDPTCSGDRHSLNDPEADLFSGRRSKERVGLPNTQLQLLLAGAAACRPGASLVYSTCTMSPAQNEAVVLSALAKLQPAFKLVDLRPLASLLVGAGCRVESRQVGLLVLPHLLANYGPSFVCKLKRVD
uniref:NOL1/NOP2/Sun domain family member 4 n=1 Tax=Macrostomum lignano TaxID=282301 RepID=A0A1I8GGZ0_9PLAT